MSFFSVLAPFVGALAGGLGTDKNTTQTTTNAPPAWALPYMEQIGSEAQNLYEQGPQEYFPGQTYADLTPEQLAGIQSQLANAGGLSGMLGQSQDAFGSLLGGPEGLTTNPAVQAALGTIENRGNQNFLENILPGLRRGATGVGQEFGTRGELAAGVAARDLGGQIADAQGAFLGNQLNSARAAQGQALNTAPSVFGLTQLPGQFMQQAGGQLQNQNQLGITDEFNRFNFGQQAPQNALGNFQNTISGLTGNYGTATQTSPTGTNPWAGAFGGAWMGNQLYNQFSPMFGGGNYAPVTDKGTQFDPTALGIL